MYYCWTSLHVLTRGAATISPPPRKAAVGVARSFVELDFDLCGGSGMFSRMSDLVTCGGRAADLIGCFLVAEVTADDVIGDVIVTGVEEDVCLAVKGTVFELVEEPVGKTGVEPVWTTCLTGFSGGGGGGCWATGGGGGGGTTVTGGLWRVRWWGTRCTHIYVHNDTHHTMYSP